MESSVRYSEPELAANNYGKKKCAPFELPRDYF